MTYCRRCAAPAPCSPSPRRWRLPAPAPPACPAPRPPAAIPPRRCATPSAPPASWDLPPRESITTLRLRATGKSVLVDIPPRSPGPHHQPEPRCTRVNRSDRHPRAGTGRRQLVARARSPSLPASPRPCSLERSTAACTYSPADALACPPRAPDRPPPPPIRCSSGRGVLHQQHARLLPERSTSASRCGCNTSVHLVRNDRRGTLSQAVATALTADGVPRTKPQPASGASSRSGSGKVRSPLAHPSPAWYLIGRPRRFRQQRRPRAAAASPPAPGAPRPARRWPVRHLDPIQDRSLAIPPPDAPRAPADSSPAARADPSASARPRPPRRARIPANRQTSMTSQQHRHALAPRPIAPGGRQRACTLPGTPAPAAARASARRGSAVRRAGDSLPVLPPVARTVPELSHSASATKTSRRAAACQLSSVKCALASASHLSAL